MITGKTEFPLKTSLVIRLLSDLRVGIEFHYIYVLHHTAEAVVDTFTGIFYDSLSQVEFNIISMIIILQRFTPRLPHGQSNLLSSADPGAMLTHEEKPEFLVAVTI